MSPQGLIFHLSVSSFSKKSLILFNIVPKICWLVVLDFAGMSKVSLALINGHLMFSSVFHSNISGAG